MSEQTIETTKTIKVPGPDHPITIERNPKRVVISIGGTIVADSNNALTLREEGYPAVHYIPREDVEMTLLERSTHTSHCPNKGECNYFSIPLCGKRGVNAVWTYENPFHAVAAIRNHLAFYQDKVNALELRHEKLYGRTARTAPDA